MSGNLCLAPVQHSALVVGQHWLISALKRIACCFSYLALLLVCSRKGKSKVQALCAALRAAASTQCLGVRSVAEQNSTKGLSCRASVRGVRRHQPGYSSKSLAPVRCRRASRRWVRACCAAPRRPQAWAFAARGSAPASTWTPTRSTCCYLRWAIHLSCASLVTWLCKHDARLLAASCMGTSFSSQQTQPEAPICQQRLCSPLC